jgi:acyl-CoA reductase-like NAD-dependent aldehyde dehydrogenase
MAMDTSKAEQMPAPDALRLGHWIAGKQVAATAAHTLKRVHLELGGKDAEIDMGPVISARQRDRVLGFVDGGGAGATVAQEYTEIKHVMVKYHENGDTL